jgi:hypothetical protein
LTTALSRALFIYALAAGAGGGQGTLVGCVGFDGLLKQNASSKAHNSILDCREPVKMRNDIEENRMANWYKNGLNSPFKFQFCFPRHQHLHNHTDHNNNHVPKPTTPLTTFSTYTHSSNQISFLNLQSQHPAAIIKLAGHF